MVGDALEVFGFCSITDVRVDVPAVALMLPDAAWHCRSFVLADLLQFLYLLEHSFRQFHSHIARVLNDAV